MSFPTVGIYCQLMLKSHPACNINLVQYRTCLTVYCKWIKASIRSFLHWVLDTQIVQTGHNAFLYLISFMLSAWQSSIFQVSQSTLNVSWNNVIIWECKQWKISFHSPSFILPWRNNADLKQSVSLFFVSSIGLFSSRLQSLVTTLGPWALRNGRQSRCVLSIFYERRWGQSLDELRQELNIEPPPVILGVAKRKEDA